MGTSFTSPLSIQYHYLKLYLNREINVLICLTINQVKQLIHFITEYFFYNVGFALSRISRLTEHPKGSVQPPEFTNGIDDQHTIVAAIVDGKGFVRHRLSNFTALVQKPVILPLYQCIFNVADKLGSITITIKEGINITALVCPCKEVV